MSLVYVLFGDVVSPVVTDAAVAVVVSRVVADAAVVVVVVVWLECFCHCFIIQIIYSSVGLFPASQWDIISGSKRFKWNEKFKCKSWRLYLELWIKFGRYDHVWAILIFQEMSETSFRGFLKWKKIIKTQFLKCLWFFSMTKVGN